VTPPTSARALSVLIVDDCHDCADSLGKLLALYGHRAQVAYDGEAAVRAARHSLPDVLLVDLAMPGMDGYELLKRLDGVFLGKPLLVAVTGHGQLEDVDRCRAAGFDHHLLKPFEPAALEALLMRAHTERLAAGSCGRSTSECPSSLSAPITTAGLIPSA
jgi:CheY-like chemotaxis protein